MLSVRITNHFWKSLQVEHYARLLVYNNMVLGYCQTSLFLEPSLKKKKYWRIKNMLQFRNFTWYDLGILSGTWGSATFDGTSWGPLVSVAASCGRISWGGALVCMAADTCSATSLGGTPVWMSDFSSEGTFPTPMFSSDSELKFVPHGNSSFSSSSKRALLLIPSVSFAFLRLDNFWHSGSKQRFI